MTRTRQTRYGSRRDRPARVVRVKYWSLNAGELRLSRVEEGRVGETTAILNVIGKESADQWEDPRRR